MLRLLPGALAGLLIVAVAALWVGPVLAAECRGQIVRASYYGTENGQTRTASGERYTGRDMTAAHRSLPFGTKLRVTHKGKSVTVRVNDRGPFVKGRSLDLSKAAAKRIGMEWAGVANVCIERLK